MQLTCSWFYWEQAAMFKWCAFSVFVDLEHIVMFPFACCPLGKCNSYKSVAVAWNIFH